MAARRLCPGWLALCILGALMLLPGPILMEMDLDNAPEAYFPEDAPAVIADDRVRAAFPQDQVIVALLRGDDIYEAEWLERLDAASREMERLGPVERVLSVTQADHIVPTEDGFSVETLVDASELDARSADEWRERVLGDRFAPDLLAGSGGDTLALVVRPHPMDNSLQRLELEDSLRDTLTSHGLDDRLAGIAGHVALDVAQLRAMLTGTALFVPATTLIGLIVIGFLFRRWLAVGIAAVTVGGVVNGALVALVLMGAPYTLITSIVPPLLSALTIAMLVHLFTAASHQARRGVNGPERAQRALDAIRRPVFYMGITTVVALLTLTLSPIRPVAAFGLVSAVGILLAVLLVLYVVPGILARWDRRDWHQGAGGHTINRVTRALSALAIRRAGWVVAITLLILAAGLPQIRHVMVETDLYAFFKEDHPVIQATREVETSLSGVMPLEVVFDTGEYDGATDPALLADLKSLQDRLDARPEVDFSLSLADMVEEMHWAFNEGDPDYRALPDSAPLISQYLFVYDGRDLHDVVDRDLQQTRILMNLNIHGARELNLFMDDVRDAVRSEVGDDAVEYWDLAGMGRLFADQETLLIQGQLRSLIAVVILMSALMLLFWRSFTAAGITMIPNLAPIAAIFSVMGILGIWLDMATALVASVAVGIAVDDTVHTYHQFRKHRLAGSSTVAALARTYRRSGRAVTATTLILCAQFLILGLSDFLPLVAFGLLTALGLVAAWLFDLLLLPALLTLWARRQERRA
ncbi:efflux RND transporter permease subunit [Aquisalimonas asiatica]|uniref:SSD domain-containing protein n=1 Tax=Aquisalimonas asiatica TaxID=406100 RepID=A0A1H8U385_9GAMM|nr:MMPL family transporter [Aquisalimonas asiatica]SEO97595.1 hypothetical protein SAMN04488052_105142 [Aquisalimonas asiatica]